MSREAQNLLIPFRRDKKRDFAPADQDAGRVWTNVRGSVPKF